MGLLPNLQLRESIGLRFLVFLVALPMAACSPGGAADSATVAVAANFLLPARELARTFERQGGWQITVVSGSTGQLYAQIVNGAPYDIFLAADKARPDRLTADGFGVAGSQFSYASGRLSLCSGQSAERIADGVAVLEAGEFKRLAIANPALAPYGVAASEFLDTLAMPPPMRDGIVLGENINQVYTLVVTATVDYGLVARSSVLADKARDASRCWEVPTTRHSAIRQDAVLLKRGEHNRVALAFMSYLSSADAASLIRSFGYDTDR